MICDFRMITDLSSFMNAMEGLVFPLTSVVWGCPCCADLAVILIVHGTDCGTDSGVLWQVESR